MKRRREQERDEAIAREQADARQEALLADLKARQTSAAPEAAPPSTEPELDESEPAATEDSADAEEGRDPEAEKA
jgi:hypothetical protein